MSSQKIRNFSHIRSLLYTDKPIESIGMAAIMPESHRNKRLEVSRDRSEAEVERKKSIARREMLSPDR